MAKSMDDQYQMFSPETLPDSPSATSLQESVSGATPCDLPDGQMTAKSGPSRARVNRSAQQGKRKGSRIDDTFFQSSFVSSKDEDLSFALANRYRLQTASLGSTLFDLTWKARRTPSGHLIYAQRARARRTSETALSSWPTPAANEYEQMDTEALMKRREKCKEATGNGNGFGMTLGNAVQMAAWPTPCVPNGGRVSSNREDMTKHADGTKAQVGLENAVRLSAWATPTKRDHKDGNEGNTETFRDERSASNGLLGRQVWLSGWQTPKMPSGGGMESRETPGGGLRKLEDQAILAGWRTPTSLSVGEDGHEAGNNRFVTSVVKALDLRTDSGGNQVGYYADQNGVAEIPVGGPLNPGHSRWLQGLPAVWESCADSAMESLRPLRRNSSKRTSKKGVTDVAPPQAETDCRMRVSD